MLGAIRIITDVQLTRITATPEDLTTIRISTESRKERASALREGIMKLPQDRPIIQYPKIIQLLQEGHRQIIMTGQLQSRHQKEIQDLHGDQPVQWIKNRLQTQNLPVILFRKEDRPNHQVTVQQAITNLNQPLQTADQQADRPQKARAFQAAEAADRKSLQRQPGAVKIRNLMTLIKLPAGSNHLTGEEVPQKALPPALSLRT
jgi:hypothetical protein